VENEEGAGRDKTLNRRDEIGEMTVKLVYKKER
jgi:hypothetical protein